MRGTDLIARPDPPVAWDPLVPLDDPYPAYRRLRDEAPCYRHPERDVWALSRFDDIVAAAKDWETFSSSVGGTGNDVDDTYQLFLPAGDLPAADPPLHTRLRGALRLAFSPSALRVRFEPAVRAKVHELIDDFIDAGRADFAYDLARPLPATTMFTWFGFPETDHPQLLDWFNDMLQRTSGERALPPVALAARDRLRVYIQDVARERRRRPGDDLMSFLVDAVARRPDRRRRAPRQLAPDVRRRDHHDVRSDLELAAPPGPVPGSASDHRPRPGDDPGRGRGAAPLRRPDPGAGADADTRRRGGRSP